MGYNRLTLALVGRPNVGKSAIFNRLCGRRLSIVHDEEGTTRDRIRGSTSHFGQEIDLIDTGGIALDSKLPFQEGVRKQVDLAVNEADLLILVVDGQVGVTAADEVVASLLLAAGKPIVLAVNKIDDLSKVNEIYDFCSLGIETMVPVSASHGFQMIELLDAVLGKVPAPKISEQSTEVERVKVAIVGRPNVGKSTLMNVMLREDRSVVSPVAGTTRDAIDSDVLLGDLPVTLIDTAGIRRKRAEKEVVDKFAALRTEDAIERADICLLLLEGPEGLTVHDKKIASMIEASGKGCLVLFNKWDLISGYRREHCVLSLREETPFLAHCPTLFISAKTGRELPKVIEAIAEVRRHQTVRITTGQLNKFLEEAVERYHPPMLQGKRLRMYYMTQTETQPPTFVVFVNDPRLMIETYQRYLVHQFRERYRFSGSPIIFLLRKHRSSKVDRSSTPSRR